jgi:hypothetical protein
MNKVSEVSAQIKRNEEEHNRIWNAAIEAAAREAELWMDETVPKRIRDLKK